MDLQDQQLCRDDLAGIDLCASHSVYGSSSLKTYGQILTDLSSLRAFLPVGDLSFENYKYAFNFAPLAKFLSNSVLITTVTVGTGLFVNSLAGFALSRLRWKGRSLILAVIIATYIIPFRSVLRSLCY